MRARHGFWIGVRPAGLAMATAVTAWMLVAVLVAAGSLGGCGLLGGMSGGFAGELETVRAEADRAREEIAADRAALEASAAGLPAGSAERARVDAMAASRAAQEAAFAQAVERLEAARAAAWQGSGGEGAGVSTGTGLDPAGTLEGGAALLAPLVPPGAQLPLILGAGFAASLWRAVRLKQSAASIAKGLEKAMAGDEGLREGMARNAATLRSVQTPTAQRIVDEVKRTGPMVRLPV